MSDLFASHISVALDEGTAFEIEKLAGLKCMISAASKQVAFYYIVNFHLLRNNSAAAVRTV
jgi:hypothetical protein